MLLIDLAFLFWWFAGDRDESSEPPEPALTAVAQEAEKPPGLVIGFTTLQEKLLDTNAVDVFMPTASGRLESALFGSTRTTQQGGRIMPSFHEGIDIAPLTRDQRQVPLDRIFSMADGRVAYISKSPGNSNYGRYVVVVHDDPMGEIYSLYAHLEEIADGLRVGQNVERGDDLGRMGYSPANIIPVARSHLHLEAGVIINQRFPEWYNRQKLKPDHGVYHGHNLRGIDPLDVYREQQEHGRFNMADYLAQREPAFAIIVKASRKPDYFRRYEALWSGDEPGGAMVVSVSEGGVPLSGRPATEAENELLGKQNSAILSVSEEALGRNGLRLVVPKNGTWHLGKNGAQWLQILLF